MNRIDNQVLGIIKEAIKLEINGRKFFQHAQEVSQNSLGKKMFQKLANDESRHLKEFGDLFSEVLKSEDWKKFVSQEEKGNSWLIEELKLRIKSHEREKGTSEIEALRIGMELERKAIDFFEKSAQESSDFKAGEICRKISEEEKFHYDLLQAQYDSVTNSGFWIDVAEFQMDGKY
jgi:rubrerythrin